MLKINKILVYFCLSLLLLVGCAFDMSTEKDSENSVKASKKIDYKLQKALNLVLTTDIGRSLEPYINELMVLEKIQLVFLNEGHFGESGEGCVIINGTYFFEGFFIDLNQSLSISMLAISIVHEATHYQMIKEIMNSPDSISVSRLEVFAFANQFQFMRELEELGFIFSRFLFSGKQSIINEIMEDAHATKVNWSKQAYEKVIEKLVRYGYPLKELNRNLVKKQKQQCIGSIFDGL